MCEYTSNQYIFNHINNKLNKFYALAVISFNLLPEEYH